MNDRELLELAAKAIGVTLYVNKAGASQIVENGLHFKFWNPLDDDGDALRLAVDLHLDVTMYPASKEVGAVQHLHNGVCYGIVNRCFERTDRTDAYVATRLAIVRAAAEIGKKKDTE